MPVKIELTIEQRVLNKMVKYFEMVGLPVKKGEEANLFAACVEQLSTSGAQDQIWEGAEECVEGFFEE